jgi:hypothetical protein
MVTLGTIITSPSGSFEIQSFPLAGFNFLQELGLGDKTWSALKVTRIEARLTRACTTGEPGVLVMAYTDQASVGPPQSMPGLSRLQNLRGQLYGPPLTLKCPSRGRWLQNTGSMDAKDAIEGSLFVATDGTNASVTVGTLEVSIEVEVKQLKPVAAPLLQKPAIYMYVDTSVSPVAGTNNGVNWIIDPISAEAAKWLGISLSADGSANPIITGVANHILEVGIFGRVSGALSGVNIRPTPTSITDQRPQVYVAHTNTTIASVDAFYLSTDSFGVTLAGGSPAAGDYIRGYIRVVG